MNKRLRNFNGITLVALVVTIVILLILAGIAIATLGGENGLFTKVKLGKERYAISEAKEKLELEITNLQIEQNGKGEELTKEDLPKMNSDEIDVRDTTNFPVEVIYKNYKFEVDSNFKVTYVGEANETIITYTTEPEGYTNQNNIKILVKITNPKGIKSILKPGETDKILPQDRTTAGIEFTVTKNGHYILKVEDVDGNEVSKDIYIDLIDTLAPLEFTPEVQKDGSSITVKENGNDADATEESSKSGIDHYEYYVIDSSNKETKYDNNKIENLKFGSYKLYVIAYDKAKNSKKSTMIQLKNDVTIYSVSSNDWGTSIIDSNGNIWCWGGNDSGQVGNGTTNNVLYYPERIKEETKFVQISKKSSKCLGIDRKGNLWAWGSNYYGQLGDGTTTTKTSPVQIKKGTRFIKIASGVWNGYGIDEEGRLWGWGSNTAGQLGDGTTTERTIPVQIKGETKFTQISAGFGHRIAIDNEGNLWTWGINESGQLGDGTKTVRTSPVQIKSGTKFTQISAGYNYSMAIDNEGNLWTWGSNDRGQLGDGTKTNRISPVQIKSGMKFTQISAGDDHSMVLDNEGNLWTWGSNDKGQLGNGTTEDVLIPEKLETKINIKKITAGRRSSFVIDNKGQLWGCGWNLNVQIGAYIEEKKSIKELTLIQIIQ